MTESHIITEDHGDHLVVINNNPRRRNALTDSFQQGFREALALAAREPRIGAVVLTGAEGFFCAGGDLAKLQRGPDLPFDARRRIIEDLQDLIRAMVACPRPVIAAVEGGAAGAGASIALACDLILASQEAKFTAAYVNAGLVPDGGLTASLTALLPPPVAAEICLLGHPVPAARLYQLGAINALTEPGAALAEAQVLARHLARGPAAAQGVIKRLLTDARADLLAGRLEAETEAMAHALAAPEAAEGIRAFLDKRAPDFAALRRG